VKQAELRMECRFQPNGPQYFARQAVFVGGHQGPMRVLMITRSNKKPVYNWPTVGRSRARSGGLQARDSALSLQPGGSVQ
jgi:hypothetical protein